MNDQRLPISVFISYAHADSHFVKGLQEKLEQQGIRVLLDETIIRVGDSVIEQIDLALKEVDAIIVVLSHNHIKSKWATLEYKTLLKQKARSKQVLLTSIHIDDSLIPTALKNHYIINSQDNQYVAEELLKKLKSEFPEKPSYEPSKINIPDISPDFIIARPQIFDMVINQLEQEGPQTIMIHGPAGSGKTTFTRLIAKECANRRQFSIVGYFDVWSYQSMEALHHEIKHMVTTGDSIKETPAKERSLIILDSLDAISSSQKSKLLNLIRGLFADSKVHIILVARDSIGQEICDNRMASFASHFIEIKIPPLSEHEIKRYLEARIKSSRDISNVLKAIRANPQLSELAKNPLLLESIISMSRYSSDLQSSHIGIDVFLEKLFTEINQAEREILYAMTYFNTPVSARTLSTICGIKNMNIARQQLDDLVSKGIAAKTRDKYEFRHLVIREFFEKKSSDEPIEHKNGTLYVTIDPTLFSKEDVVEFLEGLNLLYDFLGGEELIIREDEVGRFATAGVLV